MRPVWRCKETRETRRFGAADGSSDPGKVTKPLTQSAGSVLSKPRYDVLDTGGAAHKSGSNSSST